MQKQIFKKRRNSTDKFERNASIGLTLAWECLRETSNKMFYSLYFDIILWANRHFYFKNILRSYNTWFSLLNAGLFSETPVNLYKFTTSLPLKTLPYEFKNTFISCSNWVISCIFIPKKLFVSEKECLCIHEDICPVFKVINSC